MACGGDGLLAAVLKWSGSYRLAADASALFELLAECLSAGLGSDRTRVYTGGKAVAFEWVRPGVPLQSLPVEGDGPLVVWRRAGDAAESPRSNESRPRTPERRRAVRDEGKGSWYSGAVDLKRPFRGQSRIIVCCAFAEDRPDLSDAEGDAFDSVLQQFGAALCSLEESAEERASRRELERRLFLSDALVSAGERMRKEGLSGAPEGARAVADAELSLFLAFEPEGGLSVVGEALAPGTALRSVAGYVSGLEAEAGARLRSEIEDYSSSDAPLAPSELPQGSVLRGALEASAAASALLLRAFHAHEQPTLANGVLLLATSRGPAAWAPSLDRGALYTVANKVGAALLTDRKLREERLRSAALARQNERAALAHRITHAMRQSLDEQEIYETTCRLVLEPRPAPRRASDAARVPPRAGPLASIGASRCIITKATVNPDGTGDFANICSYEAPGVSKFIDPHDKMSKEEVAGVMQRWEAPDMNALVANSVVKMFGSEGAYPEIFRASHIASMVQVKTTYRGKLNGWITLHQCFQERVWSDDDIAFIQNVADKLALAIAQAKYVDEINRQNAALQRQLQRANLIDSITREIRQTLDEAVIFQSATRRICDVFNASRLIIKKSKMVVFMHCVDWVASEGRYRSRPVCYESIRCSPDKCKTEACSRPMESWHAFGTFKSSCPLEEHPLQEFYVQLQAEGVIAIDDISASKYAKHPLWASYCEHLNVQAAISVSTHYGAHVNGMVTVHFCERRAFAPEDVELLHAVSAQLGIAIAHASVLDQERRQRERVAAQNAALEVARMEALNACRVKSDFLSMMSHEIR
eukprot:tig00000190_g13861.t1